MSSPIPPLSADEDGEVRYRRLDGTPAPRSASPGPTRAGTGERGVPTPAQCPVFIDGATYGIEVLYPFEAECQISLQDGVPHVTGNFATAPSKNIPWPPVRWVNPEHYSILTCLDLAPDPKYLLRVEPHPRYFNDRTGQAPAAVSGNLDAAHWPMYLFLTFKSPLSGQVHVLRRDDPLAQLICVPRNANYRLTEMSATEQTLREEFAKNIILNRSKIATRSWVSNLGHRFDNLYRLVKTASSKTEE
jgi:hypothetical protein